RFFIYLRPPDYYDFCAFLRHTLIIAGGFLVFKVHFHALQECFISIYKMIIFSNLLLFTTSSNKNYGMN
ncbi:MAG: hypothetical protein PHW73_14545, partial [Atribacterota bacterium]|nr:hypothetical protein [Atribacterota bacterium]